MEGRGTAKRLVDCATSSCPLTSTLPSGKHVIVGAEVGKLRDDVERLALDLGLEPGPHQGGADARRSV